MFRRWNTTETPPLSFDDEFSTYNIGGYADIRLVSPPVTLDDTGMDCAWMANEPLFIAADTGSMAYMNSRGQQWFLQKT